ncbi:hypothetical protein P171DRAFT_505273 [Karstenula rhodostoma CBS 690.94]|uniref:Uncharacterized protein n=1 Tax=Karstenula rhodostoma CBS 690.94 TaxID=1392251 RepID=A0A9P4P4L6_9PLEO|nr:hypothetical protein P171DRAFT_505273 [Karstenula rhodostoma CBS 690.94]
MATDSQLEAFREDISAYRVNNACPLNAEAHVIMRFDEVRFGLTDAQLRLANEEIASLRKQLEEGTGRDVPERVGVEQPSESDEEVMTKIDPAMSLDEDEGDEATPECSTPTKEGPSTQRRSTKQNKVIKHPVSLLMSAPDEEGFSTPRRLTRQSNQGDKDMSSLAKTSAKKADIQSRKRSLENATKTKSSSKKARGEHVHERDISCFLTPTNCSTTDDPTGTLTAVKVGCFEKEAPFYIKYKAQSRHQGFAILHEHTKFGFTMKDGGKGMPKSRNAWASRLHAALVARGVPADITETHAR